MTLSTGRGIPNHLQVERSEIIPIPDSEVPGTVETDMYCSQGGQLTEFGLFGCDLLKERKDLIVKREEYFLSHHCFGDVFSDVVSRRGETFSNAITDFIAVTKSLEAYL